MGVLVKLGLCYGQVGGPRHWPDMVRICEIFCFTEFIYVFLMTIFEKNALTMQDSLS
jgi:hypothetical protein